MRRLAPNVTRIAKFRRLSTLHQSAASTNLFIDTPVSISTPIKHDSPLEGLRVAIKDNICTRDLRTTCGSWGLREYVSPYDASVVSKLRDAGMVIVGKTNLDEFGMGSHSTHSSFGAVNPREGHSAGGSSGGSALAIATHRADVALGTDTGGSVRLPAAYNGVVGFKPSYGRLSRWGVVAYANSLDTVGLLAHSTKRVQDLFEVLNGYDERDPTSLPPSTRKRIENIITRRHSRKQLRIGIPQEYIIPELSSTVKAAWAQMLKKLHQAGHSIHAISLPSTKQALSAYYVLAPAEASSNLAKYDSVRYGSRPEGDSANSDLLFSRARRQGFGEEVRRRILLGAYTLSADAIDNYFIQAQKVRRLVQQDFDRVFDLPNVLVETREQQDERNIGIDAIVCPTAPTLPPLLDEVLHRSSIDAYADDVFTVPASLAGIPAISIPVDVPSDLADNETRLQNIGIQVITQYGDDHLALSVAQEIETLGITQ